jgi:hypothetical protein
MMKYDYYIGIDTGVNTGFAVYDATTKTLIEVKTCMIHEALERVLEWSHLSVMVRVEDARLRKWYGTSGREALQGAGSIKRDATIWSDFLTQKNIPHQMVAPMHNTTKLSSTYFKRLTKWEARTSEHARDAAMLVFGK